MTVEYGPNGPEIRTILTYGQTGDQNSPLFTEQTEMFSEKQWKTAVPYTHLTLPTIYSV